MQAHHGPRSDNRPTGIRAAVDHLLGRGFRLDDFPMAFMSDEAFGRFENYVIMEY
jgi:hypothetical protein